MPIRRGYAALLLTLLIWGSTFSITKIALRDVAPLQLTGLRFVIAFLALAPLAARQGFKLKQVFAPAFMGFGLTGVTLYYALQNIGLNLTSVSSTVLILSIIPVITAVLAVIFLQERLTRQQVLGIGLATVGLALVGLGSSGDVASGSPWMGLPPAWVGDLLILGSAAAWAIYTIQGRRMADDHPALVMTTASTGAGLLFLLPFLGWEVFTTGLPHLTLPGLLSIAYLGLAASGLTMFLWNYALHHLPASVASPYVNLVPIIGLASAFLLGERPPVIQLSGGGLAILGVWLSSRASRR